MIGEIAGGLTDLVGGNKAANIERRATRKAGGILDKGYGGALDLAKPMQERAQGDYMNLSERYGRGEFRNPEQQAYNPGNFNYDPNSVLNDPEYKAQMQAGTQAIESGAAGKGMLFSGNTGRDLTKFGSDLFAGRSDELYGRARDQYQDDRNFGYSAANKAYDQNAATRAADYSQGESLAAYAPGALDTSLNLNLGRAQANADTELGVGGIRGDAYRMGGTKLGRLLANTEAKPKADIGNAAATAFKLGAA